MRHGDMPDPFAVRAYHAYAPDIDAIDHGLDMRDRPLTEKLQQPIPVHRGTVGQSKGEVGELPGNLPAMIAAKLGGRQSIALLEQRVKSPNALEPRGQGNLRHRDARIGQELLGQQQPLRLPEFDGRNAIGVVEDAAHVAVGNAEGIGQFRQRMPGEKILADMPGNVAGKLGGIVHGTVAGGQFGPAAFAGAIPGGLGGGGVGEKGAVLPQQKGSPTAFAN